MTRTVEKFNGVISENNNTLLYETITSFMKPFGFRMQGGYYDTGTDTVCLSVGSLNSIVGSGYRQMAYKLKSRLGVTHLMVDGFVI